MTHLTDEQAAIVALCLRLPGDPNRGWRPLTGPELSELRGWLRQQGRLLEDVLADPGLGPARMRSRLRGLVDRYPAVQLEIARLERLGIHLLTRDSLAYPQRLLVRLKSLAPPLLAVAGTLPSQGEPCLAVAGSREPGIPALTVAARLGERCAQEGITLVSGGADGIDTAAAEACLERDGQALLFLADSLERRLRDRIVARRLEEGQLTLMTPMHPAEAFTPAAAHARNRLIYAGADRSVVVEARPGRGGTWKGAVECLDHGWSPLFVYAGARDLAGNLRLLEYQGRGGVSAIALPSIPEDDLMESLDALARQKRSTLLEVLQASLAGLGTPVPAPPPAGPRPGSHPVLRLVPAGDGTPAQDEEGVVPDEVMPAASPPPDDQPRLF